MITKKIAFLFFCFVLFQNVFSQEITIPYRDGNLWGFCDEQGKIIIEPQYDSFGFTKDYSSYHDYIHVKKNNLEGIIFNGKEILKPIYYEIYESEGRFVARSNVKGYTTQIFMHDGTPVFDKEVATILDYGYLSNNIYVYHVLHPNNTESIYVFDIEQKKITQTLYENVFSVSRLKKQYEGKQFVFLVQRKANSELIEESWDATKLPLIKNKLGLRYIKESEFLKYFLDKYYQNKWNKNDFDSYTKENGNYEVTEGLTYDQVEVPSSGSGSGRGDLEVEMVESTNPVISRIEKYTLQFKKDKDGYLFEKMKSNKPNETEIKQVKLPDNATQIEIKYEIVRILEESKTEVSYVNYLRYKNGEKTSLLFANDVNNPIVFDFIDNKYTRLRSDNYSINELIFLVGNKDANNQMKYGLYSNFRKQIVPCIYEAYELISFYNANGKQLYLFTKDNKKGVIYSDGTICLDVAYDQVKRIESRSSSNVLLSITNNNKHGLVYQSEKQIKITDLIFDYPIKDFIFSYPKINDYKLFKGKENSKKVELVELMDENGKSLGYANTNGTLYFKN